MAKHRTTGWLTALVLALASCDRKPPEPKPAAVEAEAEGTVGGRKATARASTFSSSTGLLAGLDDVLGDKATATAGTATAAVGTTATDSIAIPDEPAIEPDTIGEKRTSTDATAIAEPDRVDPNAGIAGASASTREKRQTVETLAPSTSTTPSGPLALGGIDSLDVGELVQVQTKAGAWVIGTIVSVHLDGTYDVERDGVIERGLAATKLRKR